MKSTSKLSIFIVAAFVVIAVLMSSCMEPCVEGNGTIRKENRTIGSFDQLILSGNVTVYLEQGNTTSLDVEADENLISYIRTEIRTPGVLEISNVNNRCLRGTSEMAVILRTPDIYKITNSGSGKLYCDYVYNNDFEIVSSGSGDVDCKDIDTKDIKITLSGSGHIRLSGKAETSDILISGSGSITSFPMTHYDSYIRITGSGDAYVYVTDYLKATIPGSGNVFYRGHPDIDYRVDGSGRVYNSNK